MSTGPHRKKRKVHEAALQTAARQIHELLESFDATTLRPSLEGDVSRYAQLVNALSRLSQGALEFEKYRAEVAERKRRIQEQLDAAKKAGGLSPDTINAIERELNLF